jgi:glutamine cyclotransferase
MRATLLLILFLLAGCDSRPSVNASTASPPPTKNANSSATPMYSYEVVRTFPHDPRAFTQGLIFLDGAIIESTGLQGQSSLRRVELDTGKVLRLVPVPSQYFAEGLALLNGKLFQLTWQNGKGFVYDLATFNLEMEFTYSGEGWGLATDGKWLIQSDGTDQLRFMDPLTFEVKRTLSVTDQSRPVNRLNELEYIKGEIFANIWGTDLVARIDPASGKVLGSIDFSRLLSPQERARTDVLNGIAYDPKGDRLFVTGKLWPKLFEVRLKKQP